MDNVMINLMISDYAKEIKQKIEGGMLYGIPIDINNPDHVIVAVYLMYGMKHLSAVIEQKDIINTLFTGG